MQVIKVVTKVEAELLEQVLRRDQYVYQKSQNANVIIFSVECTEEDCMVILEDLECEKIRKLTGSVIPIFSLRTMENSEKLYRLLDFYNTKGFDLWDADGEKIDQYFQSH